MSDVPERFPDAARAALYRVMELRRDIRHFRDAPLADAVLARILRAAQLAPSVGFSQPWGFITIRERATRRAVRESFLRCREAEAARFSPERRAQYLSYKLEGIEEAALNLCVVADLRPREEAVLGATVQPESIRASVCCAVQNLWLAARAEGVGVGWVSIVDPAVLRRLLALPAGVEPVAYLCIGYAEELRERPLLEETGWQARRASAEVVHAERWPSAPAPCAAPEVVTPSETAPAFDEAAARSALEHQLLLTKPAGSLGRLEELAAWYAGAHGRFPPPSAQPALIAVFAADHGVASEGVSAYPATLTAAMVANVMSGGAAIACMARRLGIDVALVDVGVAGDLSAVPRAPLIPLERAAVRAGSANLRWEPAMSVAEARAALRVGERVAERAHAAGHRIVGVGEIGIANTTAAAALICALTGAIANDVVGNGTGLDERARRRKVFVVEQALVRHGAEREPLRLLASLGGFEIAAMTGFILAAARRRLPLVLDGFVSLAAALVARELDGNASSYLLASHLSAEKGAALALAALGKRALLSFDLRLGEGTGAALAIDMVRTALHTQLSMATFATAGIVGRAGSELAAARVEAQDAG